MVSGVHTIVLRGWQGFEGPQRVYVGLGGPLWVSESLRKPQSRLEGQKNRWNDLGMFRDLSEDLNLRLRVAARALLGLEDG